MAREGRAGVLTSRLVLRSVCGSWEAEGRQECILIGSGRLRSSAASTEREEVKQRRVKDGQKKLKQMGNKQ